MERPPRYQPLSREDEDEIQAQLEKDGTAWNANDTEIIPTNTRSFAVFLSLLLLSLSANILLVMDNAKLRIAHSHEKTAFSGLTFDTPMSYHAMTAYWNPNASESDMEAAWDAIDTGPMAVALDDSFVQRAKLPPTDRFPWDTERSVYYLKGIHDLHCLVRASRVSRSSLTTYSRNISVKLSSPSTRTGIRTSVSITSIIAWMAFDRT